MTTERDWQEIITERYGGLLVTQADGDDIVLVGCNRGFLLVTFARGLHKYVTFHVDRLDIDAILKSETYPRFRPMGIASDVAELGRDIEYNQKMSQCHG